LFPLPRSKISRRKTKCRPRSRRGISHTRSYPLARVDGRRTIVQQPELFKRYQPPNTKNDDSPSWLESQASHPMTLPRQNALTSRTLKIEEDGDHWRGRIKPKIRLRGHWLEKAGFKPGNRVSVNCLAHGVIELRSRAATFTLNEMPQSSHEATPSKEWV
jgi:Toxin SymE, type I toxin-antitoxin system